MCAVSNLVFVTDVNDTESPSLWVTGYQTAPEFDPGGWIARTVILPMVFFEKRSHSLSF
jgi:hypothetical protein